MSNKKKKEAKSGKTVWREALETVGGMMLWTARIGIETVLFVSIVSMLAGGVMPWLLMTLAGGLGMNAETALLDLVFIYGGSCLFVILVTAAGTFAGLRGINRQFSRVHRFLSAKLHHKEGVTNGV